MSMQSATFTVSICLRLGEFYINVHWRLREERERKDSTRYNLLRYMSNRYLLALTWNALALAVECCVLMAQLVIWIFMRLKGQRWAGIGSQQSLSLLFPSLTLTLTLFFTFTDHQLLLLNDFSSSPLCLFSSFCFLFRWSFSLSRTLLLNLLLHSPSFFSSPLLSSPLLACLSPSLSQLCYLINCLHYDEI